MMDVRLRASQEQFAIMLDFMETHGDLSRPLPGAQGRLSVEQLWLSLAELLNSVGGSGVNKPPEKWKRVWSDWKTKTKKKANLRKGKPLNSFEERVLNFLGVGSLMGCPDVPETGFEIQLADQPEERMPSCSPPALASPPVEVWVTESSTMLTALNSEPIYSTITTIQEDPRRSSTKGPSMPCRVSAIKQEDDRPAVSSVGPAAHHRRGIGPRRRRHPNAFVISSSDYYHIEEGRMRIDEMRIRLEHEREMKRIKVEASRVAVEERRNEILERISDNLIILLSRTQQ